MNPAARTHHRSITESPWYWVYVFCTGGLIALVIIGPKYAQRQSQIEQNGQKRQWAAQRVAGRTDDASPAESSQLSVKLWPLFALLGAVLSVAWIKLIRDHWRRRAAANAVPPAVAEAADAASPASRPTADQAHP